MRRDERRGAERIAGLVVELVRKPAHTVGRPFDDRLAPHERHLREQMVGVDRAHRVQHAAHRRERGHEPARRTDEGQELHHGEADEHHCDERERGRSYRRTSPRREGRERTAHARRDPGELLVVEDEEQQRDGEVVEEAVVRGEQNTHLHAEHEDERRETDGRRAPQQERQPQLDDVREERARLVRPERHLVRPPADPRGQRCGLVVGRHRGEVAPGRIAESAAWRRPTRSAGGRRATARGRRRSDAAAAPVPAGAPPGRRAARAGSSRAAGCPTGTTGSPARRSRTTGRGPRVP